MCGVVCSHVVVNCSIGEFHLLTDGAVLSGTQSSILQRVADGKVDGAAYDVICRISQWHKTLTLVSNCEFPVRGPVGWKGLGAVFLPKLLDKV